MVYVERPIPGTADGAVKFRWLDEGLVQFKIGIDAPYRFDELIVVLCQTSGTDFNVGERTWGCRC